jgi:hypothetical protein
VKCLLECFFILLAFSFSADAGDDGIIAHYKFNEGSGKILKDISGNGNDGKIVGAVYVPSPRGKALRFDGKDDYVNIGNAPSLNLTGDLTIIAWIKPTELSGNNRIILGDT